jgi:hypothetical protein
MLAKPLCYLLKLMNDQLLLDAIVLVLRRAEQKVAGALRVIFSSPPA